MSFRQQIFTEDLADIYSQTINDDSKANVTDGDDSDQDESCGEDDRWLKVIFGCRRDGPAAQELGSVKLQQGRLITFPSILQHRINEFQLVDPAKPGHWKTVFLYLVDPNVKIISTAHVPCQQREWWWDSITSGSWFRSGHRTDLGGLPVEIQHLILEFMEDGPLISLEDAHKFRSEFLEEKVAFAQNSKRAFEYYNDFW